MSSLMQTGTQYRNLVGCAKYFLEMSGDIQNQIHKIKVASDAHTETKVLLVL